MDTPPDSTVSEHPDNLAEYIAGTLDTELTAQIAAHITQCDVCLARIEALWQQKGVSLAHAAPYLSQTQSDTIRTRLARQINRSDLNGNIVRMFSAGVSQTILAMLKPLLARRPDLPSTDSKDNSKHV